MRIHNPLVTGSLHVSSSTSNEHYFIGASVGIGTTSPDTELHIHQGSAGSVGTHANYILTLEGSSDVLMQFRTPNNRDTVGIVFGDPDDQDVGRVIYDHTTDRLNLFAAGTQQLQIGSNIISGSSTSTGSFGTLNLGDSSHIHTLSIKGQSEGSTGIRVRHPSDDTLFEVIASEDDGRLRLFANNSRKIQLHANDVSYFNGGNVGIGTESPSRKLHVEGDALVTGILTAQEFHTEFVSASVVFTSGSTKFGDSSDDIHSMSGSLRVTGSGNHYIQTGNVGIGTTAPAQPLHVFSSGNGGLEIDATGGAPSLLFDIPGNEQGRIRFLEDDTTLGGITYETNGTDYIAFNVESNTERMRIAGSGNVGIGTNNPDTLLHLKSTSASKPVLTIENEQGGSNPTALRFKRVTSSPDDNDNIGQIEFRINNDNDEDTLYSYIQAIATDVSDGTEDAKLDFFTMAAGTSTRTLTMAAGQVSVTDHFSIAATKAIFLDGGSNTFIRESSSDNIEFATNNTVRLDINNTAAIFKQPNYKISGSATSTGSFGQMSLGRAAPGGAALGITNLVLDVDGQAFFRDTPRLAANKILHGITGAGTLRRLIGFDGNDCRINDEHQNIIMGAAGSQITIGGHFANVSGSATSTGSFGHGFFGGNVNIETSSSLIFTPPVYTGAVQGIKFDDGGAIDAIIQPARLASNQGIIIYLGANSFVNTSGGTDRYSDSSASSGIEIRPDSGQIRFLTNTSAADPLSRMAINSDGKVGIGTDSPSELLTLHHSAGDGDGGILIVNENTTIADNTFLGGIGWDSADGNIPSTVGEAGAAIVARSAEAHSTTDKGADLLFLTAPIDQDDDTTTPERMRIDSEGRVGIGVSDPDALLEVGPDANSRSIVKLTSTAAAKGAFIQFFGNDAESAVLGYEGGSEIVGSGVQGDFVIRNVLSAKDIILTTNAGNVGINTVAPTANLHIMGDNGDQLTLDNDGDQFTQVNFSQNGTAHTFIATDHTNKTLILGAQGSFSGFKGVRIRPNGNDDIMSISGSVATPFVGIGTTSPESELHLKGAFPTIILEDSDVSNLKHKILAGGDVGLEYSADVNNVGTGYHRFDIGNSEKMRLVESGRLGINENTPTANLHIEAGSDNATGGIRLTNDDTGQGSTDGTVIFIEQNTTDFFIRNYENAGIRLRTNDTDALYVSSGQNVGIGTVTPDSNLHIFSTSANKPKINLESQNAGSQGPMLDLFVSSSSPATGDELGDINFVGMDSTGVKTFYSSIRGMINNPTNGSETGRIHLSTRVNGSSSPRLVISGSNVGIGTTAPEGNLHVRSAATSGRPAPNSGCDELIIEGSGDSGLTIFSGTSNSGKIAFGDDNHDIGRIIYDHSANDMAFFTGGSERVTINSTGVGIKETSPSTLLHISQATASYGVRDMPGIRVQNANAGTSVANAFMHVNAFGYSEMGVNSHATGDTNRSAAWVTDSSHQFWVDGYNVGTEHFRIAHDGTLTATDTTIGSISDERTKQNIQTYSGSLSMINTLRPVTFEWKSDRKGSGRHRGFIAQEVTSSDDYWVTSSSIEPHAPDWGYLEGMPQIDSGAPTGSRSALISKLTEKDTMYVSAIQELTQAHNRLLAAITGSTDLNQLKASVSGTFIR